MVKSCCVKYCKSESYAGCGISFHNFPKDEDRKKKWLDIVPSSQKITKDSVVCSNHFKKEDFHEACSRKLLKEHVIPSIFPLTFVAIAVPIDIPDKNVFVSYNFESNYSTLNNITEIDEVLFPNLPVITSRQSRSITRELAYTVLETRFKENGMNGRECLLRNICEAAETPLHHNGLLGHIMHIIFTPSASKEEGLDDEYYEAELEGQRGNCDRYLDDCPFSLFDMITRLVEIQSGNNV